MKPACWEACFLYPCPTVEHSNNCLLLLCVLFLKPSGHYTKITDFDSRIHIDDTTTIANLSAQIKTGFQCVYLKSANLKPNYGHGVILELNNASGLYAIRIISWDDDTPNIGMYYGIKLSPSTLIKDVSYFSLQVNR